MLLGVSWASVVFTAVWVMVMYILVKSVAWSLQAPQLCTPGPPWFHLTSHPILTWLHAPVMHEIWPNMPDTSHSFWSFTFPCPCTPLFHPSTWNALLFLLDFLGWTPLKSQIRNYLPREMRTLFSFGSPRYVHLVFICNISPFICLNVCLSMTELEHYAFWVPST